MTADRRCPDPGEALRNPRDPPLRRSSTNGSALGGRSARISAWERVPRGSAACAPLARSDGSTKWSATPEGRHPPVEAFPANPARSVDVPCKVSGMCWCFTRLLRVPKTLERSKSDMYWTVSQTPFWCPLQQHRCGRLFPLPGGCDVK